MCVATQKHEACISAVAKLLAPAVYCCRSCKSPDRARQKKFLTQSDVSHEVRIDFSQSEPGKNCTFYTLSAPSPHLEKVVLDADY